MPLACMTCMAMYGNGAVIGMATTQALHKAILQALPWGRSACTAAVAGTSVRAFAGRRAASAAPRTAAASALASALFLPSKQGYFHSSF